MSATVDGGKVADKYSARITIDYDGKGGGWRFGAVKAWHNLQDIADEVEVHVSSGQHGLHFVAWFVDEIPMHEEIAIRRTHGDDPRRIDMDIQRFQNGIFTGVLFEEKGHESDAKKSRGFRDIHDALDYIDAQQDDHSRMNKLANQGHKGAPDLARRANL